MAWGIKSKAERVRIATAASHVAAAKRKRYATEKEAMQAWRSRRPDKRHLRGNRNGHRRYVVMHGPSGWAPPAGRVVLLTARQLELMSVLARVNAFEHGHTTVMIADVLGIDKASVGNFLMQLRRKFGLHSRAQLLPVAKEFSRNGVRRAVLAQAELRGRGRHSNRASTIATVSAMPARAGALDSAPHSEALHPGAAPSRAL